MNEFAKVISLSFLSIDPCTISSLQVTYLQLDRCSNEFEISKVHLFSDFGPLIHYY